MEKKLLEIIQNNALFNKGERVIVACSGGADSVALLVMLNKIKNKLGIELFAVHVNHNIRGEEANSDEREVVNLSKSLGIPCVLKSVDAVAHAKEMKQTLEQSARELRYSALRLAKEELGAQKIAVAHNLGDQTETVLMHIFRGAGLEGALGMDYVVGDIVRPMLKFDKEDLIQYLNSSNISFREDSTNSDLNYTRNYIRRKVIKDVEKVYPSASKNIVRFADRLKEVEDFINSQLPHDLLKTEKNGILIKNAANNLHPVLLSKLIISALNQMECRVDIEEKHIGDIVALLGQQVGKKLSLPNGVEAIRSYDGVKLEKKGNVVFESMDFEQNRTIKAPLGTIVTKREKKLDLTPNKQFIDLDKLPQGSVWRMIQNGDKFTKFSGGTKTVSKFLTDKKIDSSVRKKMVVLACGGEVLVIPGVELTKELKVTKESQNIASIKLEMEK